MTDWREIPAVEIDWAANPISERAGYKVITMCSDRFDQGTGPLSRFSAGAWADLTLGEIADLGPTHWLRCSGIGGTAVRVIKWVIDHAAAGKCPMKAGSGKPAHDAYVPRPVDD